MTTPFESDPADAAEQAAPVAGAPGSVTEDGATPALPTEADPFDAAEQAAPVTGAARPADLPLEADPADAAEQGVVVEVDEDERR
jgi:hypothetical protein